MTEQTSIDVVIVSDAKNDYLKSLTLKSIATSFLGRGSIVLNCFVIEKGGVNYNYPNVTTIHTKESINYNKFLNLGACAGKSDYILFCNNDLVFDKYWASKLINAMIEHKANSASPYCPISHKNPPTGIEQNSGVHEGYRIRYEFAGWAFCLTRELWNRMPLDERVEFWCSDNAVTEQLKSLGEKHILVTDSIVEHIGNGSNTLKQTPIQETAHLLHPQVKKFNRLYDTNLWNLGKD